MLVGFTTEIDGFAADNAGTYSADSTATVFLAKCNKAKIVKNIFKFLLTKNKKNNFIRH